MIWNRWRAEKHAGSNCFYSLRNKHKVAFKNCQQGNDTLELFKSRLVQEARLAYPEVKPWKLNSFEVVIDRFVDGLRSEAVQLEVRRGHPKNLEEGECGTEKIHGAK